MKSSYADSKNVHHTSFTMRRLHYRQGRAGLSVAPRSVLCPSVAGFQAGESLDASSAHLLHIWLLRLPSMSSGLLLPLALSSDLCPDVVPHRSYFGLNLLLCPRLGYDLFTALGSCSSSLCIRIGAELELPSA